MDKLNFNCKCGCNENSEIKDITTFSLKVVCGCKTQNESLKRKHSSLKPSEESPETENSLDL